MNLSIKLNVNICHISLLCYDICYNYIPIFCHLGIAISLDIATQYPNQGEPVYLRSSHATVICDYRLYFYDFLEMIMDNLWVQVLQYYSCALCHIALHPEHVLWNFSEIPIKIVELFPKFLLCFLGKTE